MRWKDFIPQEIKFNRYKFKEQTKQLPDKCIWIEVRWWYDWIAYYQDKEWNRYSVVAYLPLKDNELCKYWKIYTVEQVWQYNFKYLSVRDDCIPY